MTISILVRISWKAGVLVPLSAGTVRAEKSRTYEFIFKFHIRVAILFLRTAKHLSDDLAKEGHGLLASEGEMQTVSSEMHYIDQVQCQKTTDELVFTVQTQERTAKFLRSVSGISSV